MSNILVVVFAYFIDKLFGDFNFIKHPLSYVSEMNSFFEEKFYKNTVLRGLLLVMFVIGIVSFISVSIALYLAYLPLLINVIITATIASMFITHINLTNRVKLNNNLIAPLFYLLFFGLVGIILYKTINSMHSLVDNKKEKYDKYGKVIAKLDEILNYIPSRLTNTLIKLLKKHKANLARTEQQTDENI